MIVRISSLWDEASPTSCSDRHYFCRLTKIGTYLYPQRFFRYPTLVSLALGGRRLLDPKLLFMTFSLFLVEAFMIMVKYIFICGTT